MGERIRRAGQVAWAVVGIAFLLGLIGYVAWFVRVVWPPLILAGALVFVLNPVVTGLHRRGIPRVAGTALSYLAILAVVVLAGFLVAPLATDQADQLSDDWPEIRADLEEWVDDRAKDSEDWPIQIPTWAEIEDELEGGDEPSSISETVERVRDVGGRVLHLALIAILTPIIAFYLLVDLPRLGMVARSLIPAGSRDEVLHVAHRLARAIGGFFRGQLLVALIVGVMVSIGLLVIGLPFWLLVGMVAGLFNIIPLIGPWVGGIPGVAIALTTRDASTAVWVVIVMVVAQQIDNHFVSPLVMKRAVKLHPAAVLLALLAGGTIGGFFGLLLAVPAAAVLKIIVGHLWRTYVLGEQWDEAARKEVAADTAPGVGVVQDVVSVGAAPEAPPEPGPPPAV